jgi:hypothetical protein
LASASVNAAVVNLTLTEDATSFTSTWQITDNGGGDFSGSDSVLGTYWQLAMSMDSNSILQDSIGHVLGPHDESFISSPYDYGMLPTGFTSQETFVVHSENGHKDAITMTSNFVDNSFLVSLSGTHMIPIPATAWLFGSGLALLGWLKRKRA